LKPLEGEVEMKKIITLLGVVFGSVLLLMSCGTNNLGEESPYGENTNQLGGVAIELTQATYQPEGDTFELRVINDSDEQITYGAPYTLEYNDEGTWYEVETDEEIAFIMIAHILDAGDEATEELNLEFYEPLDLGHYRIVRQINEEPLTAEFEVVEN